ncbi:uncharacterized protein METZ01_LOCUS278082, partial [marine metagenome]
MNDSSVGAEKISYKWSAGESAYFSGSSGKNFSTSSCGR